MTHPRSSLPNSIEFMLHIVTTLLGYVVESQSIVYSVCCMREYMRIYVFGMAKESAQTLVDFITGWQGGYKSDNWTTSFKECLYDEIQHK